MIEAAKAPQRTAFGLGRLAFLVSVPLALLNGVALFFMAGWNSVPAHHAVPNGQALPSPEAAAAAGLPFWGLLVIVTLAFAASIIAATQGHARLAAGIATVQFAPIVLLGAAAAVASFL